MISKEQFFIGKFKDGFTLIELLTAVALIAIISIVGISSFGSYNRSQVLRSAVSDVATMLSTAKSRSISQVKPSQCGATQALSGYQVSIPTSSSYELDALCAGVSPNPVIQAKTLPNGVSLSGATVFFNVSTGTVSTPSTLSITISGFGNNKIIQVDPTGNITLP